jgi:dTDP-glucose 4,6-dehydratase
VTTFLITGGSGFIGSALCRRLVRNTADRVVNLDSLTYAGTSGSLRDIAGRPNYRFYRADIREERVLSDVIGREQPDVIVNLAAETHVDRSIDDPVAFVDTNVLGTARLATAVLRYWDALPAAKRGGFRFVQVSTDEVFGELDADAAAFNELSSYAPRSPYAASKASADHLVRAWGATYGLPVIVTNCSNNYGPFQFPEKLIPLTILNALEGKPIAVYGAGENVRDWLFVEDHVEALEVVATRGRVGETYLIGGRNERANISVVELICDVLDEMRPRSAASYRELIGFVTDRRGHDRRYAIDPGKIERELGWTARTDFADGLRRTVTWYLENEWWWGPLRRERYDGGRLGERRTAGQ